MVEERIDEARSRQDEVDTNEQVFRELQRRAGKGRAQSLGAAWLDGVSVSQGHLVVPSTADIDFDDFWLSFTSLIESRGYYFFHGYSLVHPVLLASIKDRHLPSRQPYRWSDHQASITARL